MYLPLTDLLTCPRCGPEHGLILLAERVEERRVLEGWLACPVCRERYRITGGFADLRTAPALPGAELAPEPGGREEALRLAALMGLAPGPGYALVAGAAAVLAPAIAALIERIEVVAVDAALAGWREEAGTSRLAAGNGLPFFGRSLRGVALAGESADGWLDEGVRVLAPPGRLVLEGAPADAGERLERAGLRVIADERGTVVAGWD